jgi:hypothetical protein
MVEASLINQLLSDRCKNLPGGNVIRIRRCKVI